MKPLKIYGDPHRCYCCNIKETIKTSKVKGKKCRSVLEVHHIKPTHEGGKDIASNKIVLCGTCHSKAHLELILFDKWYNFGYTMKMKWVDVETGEEHLGPYVD